MCRNIRPLHNFEPPATRDEVTAAALQYVRKVSGTTKPSQANQAAFDRAVQEIAHITAHLLDDRDVAARHWAGRTDRAFPYGALHRAGVRLAFGSDAPVALLDPWLAIDAAVHRAAPGDAPFHAAQAVAADVALASSVDGEPLALRVGGPGDLVVLDDDPVALAATPGGLVGIGVAGTMVAGRWAFRDGSL